MSIFTSLKAIFSSQAKAEVLFASAMEKAKQHKVDAALEDYSAVLRLEKASPSLKAMAQFNRALAYSSAGRYTEAKSDLDAVLAAPQTPANVRSAAKAKQERMRKLSRE